MKVSSYKNLHLLLSGIVVILAGLVYGGYPTYFMPLIFDFEVDALDLENILRAVMGIYIGIGIFFFDRSKKKRFLESRYILQCSFYGRYCVWKNSQYNF